MSERMKQGGRWQGMTPAALWQHQRRGREALQLEIAGEYDAAARQSRFSSGRLLTVHITARRAGYPAPCGGEDLHESDRKTAGVEPV